MSIRLTDCSLPDRDSLRRQCALQIEQGLITAVGSREESAAWPPADRQLSLNGRIVLPGLIDAHMHLENWARRHSQPSLDAVASLADLLRLLSREVRQREAAGDLRGLVLGGWNEEIFPERRPPTIRELDEISQRIPIILTRICGHVCVVNSAVLREFDWQHYAAAEPGSVGLDAGGRPNGILSENCMSALLARQEKPGADKQADLLLFGLQSMAAYGLTAVASQDTDRLEDVAFLDSLAAIYQAHPALPAYYAQIGLAHPDEIPAFLALQKKYREHPQIRIASVKLFKDGSLGGRTALLREPYSDDPANRGQDLLAGRDLLQWFESANKAGVQLLIHAIGDRAVSEIIAAFQAACHTAADRSNPRRHSIIHCQITDRLLLQKLAATKLLVVSQPLFARSDWTMAQARLGSRRRDAAYDYRGILDQGIPQAFSSDSPVESANPLLTLAAALDHPQAGKSLSFGEALAASSRQAAYVLGEDRHRGVLCAGAAADLTVLQATKEEDLTAENLRKLKIGLTMRDGKIIFEKFNTRACW